MNDSLKEQFVKNIWQPLKAVICAIHLYPLYFITLKSQEGFEASFSVLPSLAVDIFTPLTMVLAMFALWKFYDGIDDVSFVDLCCEEEPKPFLRRLTWLISLVISTVGCGIPVGWALWKAVAYSGMLPGVGIPLCMILGFALAFFIRGLLIFLLYRKWNEQKVYYHGTERYPSLVKRIIQAGLFALALVLACVIGIATLLWSAYTLAYGGILLMLNYLWPIVFAMVLIFVIRRIKLLASRGKFLKRLKKMKERGDIHYDYMGHPYLSVLFRRVYFALIITDYKDGVGANKKPKTYRVVMVGTRKRRLIIACENNTYQFKHEMRLRMGAGAAMIASAGNINETGVAFRAWYSTHGVAFPETDIPNSENVLIFDPVPYGIFIRTYAGRDDMTPLDNGSKVYGYTVWAKNSFANYLERS